MAALAKPFRIIAHRGASGYAPENTMAAFERAVAMGATEVETDVTLTRDGALLLFHDNTLERTTSGTGRPEDWTLTELKQLDAGSWHDPTLSWDRTYAGEKVVTLDELLDRFGSALTYHIELKSEMDGLVPAVIDAVTSRGLLGNVFLCGVEMEQSFAEAQRLAPGIRIATAPETLLRDDPVRAIEEAAASGYAMVTLNARNQTRAVVEHAHALGLEARSSGIGNREMMAAAAELGCNGMTINWPDWLIDYVRTRR